ncbi:oligosaccharide flippase family protein [Candidatus Bathyarchaeota archaeon]|nr:oligosaccharide flippase family protein [Candidatus Bathyarchaeota archaeon]
MQKALEMGKKSATGSFQLFIGVAASTIIMAIGTIILARLIKPEEYGLYTIALIPSYMANLFRDWGVNSAIARYTASLRAENKDENAYPIIISGIIFELAAGLALSIILVALSGFIASTVFQRPGASSLIAVASVTVLAGALLAAAQSTFIGFERMELNSLTSICQAIAKTITSPLLVFAGYGALGATLGYTISFIFATIIGLIALYLAIIRGLKARNAEINGLSQTLKAMLRYGIPLSIASIISGFLAQFYAFLMAIYCTDTMIGNYQVATQFATLLTFFSIPISTVLFPVFSKINPKKEGELLQSVFASSVKYTAIFLVPATTAIMVLSKPMICTLFGEKWAYAPLFLTMHVIGNLFAIFGNLSLGNLLAGLGETKTQMKLSLITLAFGMPLAFVLIPSAGIVGLITTSIVAGLPSLSIGSYWVWKHYNVRVDIKSSTKILATSFIAAATTFLVTNTMAYADWIKLVAGITTFLITYIVAAPAVGAVEKADVANLKIMFSGLGVISKLLSIPLSTMEAILGFLG